MKGLLIGLKTAIAGALPRVNRLLEDTIGLHLVRRHYYSPIPDRADLPDTYWNEVSPLPGVDLGLANGIKIIDEVVPRSIDAFRSRYPLNKTVGSEFFLLNGTYMAVDAHIYWCLINQYRPRRIVEIGAHASTMISTSAVAHLMTGSDYRCQIDAIEPFPSDYLRRENGRAINLIERKVQDVPLGLFTSLESGDMLFIDSTHVLREGSDVQFEYLTILPQLKPGVFVHVHDVSLPKRYPKVYFDKQLYWNEQYLLQAFLAFNSRFDVVWAGNAMMLAFPEKMLTAFPEIRDMRALYPLSEPTAFWMRVKGWTEQGDASR